MMGLFAYAAGMASLLLANASAAPADAANGAARTARAPEFFAASHPGSRVLVPIASSPDAGPWRYTTVRPEGDWRAVDFDDASWESGAAPFGAGKAFIGPWRTAWQGKDIWLRRGFTLGAPPQGRLVLAIFHDEDVEVFLNGAPVFERKGFRTGYLRTPLETSATELLRLGANTLAVHCHQTGGGQGVDVGLALVSDPNDPLLKEISESARSATAVPAKAGAKGGTGPFSLKREMEGRLTTRWAKDVSPETVWPEYPRPAMVRPKWFNLNGLWEYAIVGPEELPKTGNLINAEADPLVKSTPEAPAKWDGEILVPFAPESPLSRVGRFISPNQILWYRRTVEIPADWRGQRVLLHFEAVDWHCVAFVNGQQVGEHKGGYVPFVFDATDALKEPGAQEIALAVWDPNNFGDQSVGKQSVAPRDGADPRYPATTGIWQTVWIEPVPSAAIDRLVLTPDVDHGALTATIRLRGEGKSCSVELRAFDGERLVGSAEGAPSQAISLKVPDAKLWSPDAPFLYDLKATLKRDGQTVDEVAGYFGMRKIEVKREAAGMPRIQLNGEPIFLFGPLDQGYWPDGVMTPPTDAAERFEVQYLKDIGCNMARVHVTAHPERWYYWCDKLGIAVLQDFIHKRPKDTAADSSTARQWEAEQRDLMDSLRNHPSLLEWIVFNESWGQYDTERITQWVMRYDPSRVVCNATGWNDFPLGDTFDIHDYSYHPSVAIPGQLGGRAMCIGECGGFNVYVPGHTWDNYPPVEKFDPAGDDFRPSLKDGASWEKPYRNWLDGLWLLRSLGLCSAVYTQIYDVGGECNGWLTYDRAVSKIPVETLRRLHDRLYRPIPQLEPILPLLAEKGGTCRWQAGEAPSGWEQPDFDDAAWQETGKPLGSALSASTSVSVKDGHVFVRRAFMLEEKPKDAVLRLDGWAQFTVRINGRRAFEISNGRTESCVPTTLARLPSEGPDALRPGRNVIAVELSLPSGKMQTKDKGAALDYFDAGLFEVVPAD
ncbi:MAG: hypothetical protein NTW86_03210 [Candidatus Sumerlaeota bacterium]|nr:hypothetical protein [Candidatus Sumerlaeota bacterium]